MKDGSMATFPEGWNRAVAMLEEESMRDFVFMELSTDGSTDATDSCAVGSR